MTASSIALAAITEDNPYDLSDFDKEIQLTNGSIYPNYTEASQFGENGACEFVQVNWGWSDSNCLAVDKILYKDKTDTCYKFTAKEVKCPARASKIMKYPIQSKIEGVEIK